MGVIGLAEQVACIEREIGFRVKLYPRWVRDGKLTQAAADLELERMRAVLATLQLGGDAGIRQDERRRVLALVQKRNSSVYLRLLPIVERELGPV